MSTSTLGAFGVSSADCLGRTHQERLWSDVDPFEFDLRRVLNSTAFRRLQYKTQVFVSPQDDHFRTRLTHTLEVASISRLLARALRLNVALAEVIALAHDLGHPPFGHAGERALNELMSEHGGFEHNVQSLRVVEYLEHPFPPFRGLNLTYEVRESLIKHRTVYDRPMDVISGDERLQQLLDAGPQPPLEGQVVSLADRIAYDCHDLEDALGAGLVTREDLASVRLWSATAKSLGADPGHSLRAIRRPVLEQVQRLLIDDLVAGTHRSIQEHGVDSADAVRREAKPLISMSAEMEDRVRELEGFLSRYVYAHPKLKRMDQMAGRMIGELFRAYLEEPHEMPERFRSRIEEQGSHRVVGDFISGMTDRYCAAEYRRIFTPFS